MSASKSPTNAFQCSSASRKFLNPDSACALSSPQPGFSALQRAENFSIASDAPQHARPRWFQCSSASRKFLNTIAGAVIRQPEHVSVLFSEPKISQLFEDIWRWQKATGFQCSSASRKFLNRIRIAATPHVIEVSVLFSEPKISQLFVQPAYNPADPGFSALQRAENFSIFANVSEQKRIVRFQCSSASRKFLNYDAGRTKRLLRGVSVLFSEPKISQSTTRLRLQFARLQFQCSSASRKFLNFT